MSKEYSEATPTFEQVPGLLDWSFRLLTWKESLEHPEIHHGQINLDRAGGMGHCWHYHPEIELTHFASGEGLRLVGDSIQSVNAPETVLLGSLLPHQWQVGESHGVALQFRAGEASVFGEIPEIRELNFIWQRADRGLLFNSSLASRVGDCLWQAVSEQPARRLGTIIAILAEIGEALVSGDSTVATELSGPINVKSKGGSYSEIISEAIEYIRKQFREEISLEDVLKHVSISRATFSRHFPTYTGQSFTTFLQQCRLEYCRRLLIMGEHTITEAAMESGFQNLSHFNRLFRARWGETPSAFLKASAKQHA